MKRTHIVFILQKDDSFGGIGRGRKYTTKDVECSITPAELAPTPFGANLTLVSTCFIKAKKTH